MNDVVAAPRAMASEKHVSFDDCPYMLHRLRNTFVAYRSLGIWIGNNMSFESSSTTAASSSSTTAASSSSTSGSSSSNNNNDNSIDITLLSREFAKLLALSIESPAMSNRCQVATYLRKVVEAVAELLNATTRCYDNNVLPTKKSRIELTDNAFCQAGERRSEQKFLSYFVVFF